MLKTWLKLTHHRHTGRLRPHSDTSYVPLGVLLLIVGFVLTGFTAVAQHPPPQEGSIGLYGKVPGKPPTIAAKIVLPTDGQRFTTSPVTVSGTCPPNLLVELYKNDIFAGSTGCGSKGDFSLEGDLLIGQNILIARVYDNLNQPGPDSNAVTVFYDAVPGGGGPLARFDFGGPQMLLSTDAVFRGTFPDQEMRVPLTIIGGTPPFAVNIEWGDDGNNLVPRNDNIQFVTVHKYKKAGIYQISFQATDAEGRVAFLTVAAIISGQPDPIVTGTVTKETTNWLLALWPLYVAAVAVLISFWLGERREKHVLDKRGLLLPTGPRLRKI